MIIAVIVIVVAISGFIFFLRSAPESRLLPPREAANIFDALSNGLGGDIEAQRPLENPPKIIKAVYATSYSAGNETKLDYLFDLIETTELNAIVIDIKDFSGIVGYDSDLPLVNAYGAEEPRIKYINKLVKRFHDKGIYVIGRIAVFEDQKLALAKPDLALKSKSTGKLWRTKSKLFWMDTASKEVWDYNVAIAKDVLSRGFDEVNFDYIRFASDGNLDDIVYPVWDGQISKRKIVRSFHEYIRNALPTAKISADFFGMVTTNKDDLGIGQYLEDALPYYDAIAPMVYPSHYSPNFIGLKNPAANPYEVVRYSLDEALRRLDAYKTSRDLALAQTTTAGDQINKSVPLPARAKLRPWLQDFKIGANYGPAEIKAQIKATVDAAAGCRRKTGGVDNECGEGTSDELLGPVIDGWMLWNARNVYTSGGVGLE